MFYDFNNIYFFIFIIDYRILKTLITEGKNKGKECEGGVLTSCFINVNCASGIVKI
jgi:hypothetical protein